MNPNCLTSIMLAISASIATALPARADDRAAFVDFLSKHGCVIGPDTREAAIAEGFSADFIDAVARVERHISGSTATGDWLLLAPESCTIRPPEIDAELTLEDPDVQKAISEVDEHVADGYPGCFLHWDRLDAVKNARGWDDEKLAQEYTRLVASGLIAQEMSFYSDNQLSTPLSYFVTTGACADIAVMPAIRESQAFLITNFDPILRAMMANNSCEKMSSGLDHDVNAAPGLAPGTQTSNVWVWADMISIGAAAGWYEDASTSEIDVPRPPLCHYSEGGDENP